MSWTGGIADWLKDLFYFRRNADELRRLNQKVAQIAFKNIQSEELFQENQRLTRLLGLRQTIPPNISRTKYARVIARAPVSWNRTLIMDKGARDGIRPNRLVLSEFALVGKVIEVGPSASKVLLVTDPNFKIGVIVQRTRQQGILYATPSGECRVKYLSLDEELKEGDIVETSGFLGLFPKGISVGVVQKASKEPGQIYQVARIKPVADLAKLEEVIYVE